MSPVTKKTHKIRFLLAAFIFGSAGMLAGCVTTNEDGTAQIQGFENFQQNLNNIFQPRQQALKGTLSLPEGATVPPGARLETLLMLPPAEDGAEPQQIAEAVMQPINAIPVEYSLPFTPADIDAETAYLIRARIYDGNEILYANRVTGLNPMDMLDASIDFPLMRVLPQSTNAARQRVEEINARLGEYRRIMGRHDVGGSPTEFTAFIDNERPVLISETRELPGDGRAEASFHYMNGQLLRYFETGERRIASGERAGEILQFQLELFYSGRRYLGGAKTVDGEALPPSEQEIRAAHGRGQALRERLGRAIASENQAGQ